MEDSGIGLPEEKRNQVVQLNKEISELSNEALANINHDNSIFQISEKDLANIGRVATN